MSLIKRFLEEYGPDAYNGVRESDGEGPDATHTSPLDDDEAIDGEKASTESYGLVGLVGLAQNDDAYADERRYEDDNLR